MADGIIAFPFRFSPSGGLVTVPDGSDKEVEQIVAVTILSRIGERLLNPLFGIPDPVFAGIDVADIQTALNTFGPRGINVRTLSAEMRGNDQSLIRVGWQRED